MKIDYQQAQQRLLDEPGVVMLMGDIDTGKTSFGIELARRATERGIPTALIDADIVQSTIGPPTTVGMKLCSGLESFDRAVLRVADALGFVGSLVPKGHLL